MEMGRIDAELNLSFQQSARRAGLRHALAAAAILAVVPLLSGCGGGAGGDTFYASQSHGPQTFPDNYKSDLLGLLRPYLTDPTNLRDPMVAEPTLRDVRGRSLYVACVRYNAKDALGRYKGATQHLAIYVDGRLDSLSDNVGDACAGANYAPFPEAEQLKR